MLDASRSGCVNHPGVEAVSRCKQCGKGVCSSCLVTAATGRFCSEDCKGKYERFVQRAQQMQSAGRGHAFATKLKMLLVKIAILVVLLGGLGFASVKFQIPVLEGFTRWVMGLLSSFLPFLK